MSATGTSRRYVPSVILFFAIAVALTAAQAPALEVMAQVDDPGGSIGRTNSPASAEVLLTDAPLVAAAKDGRLVLIDLDAKVKRPIPAQFVAGADRTNRGRVWWMMRPGPAGKRRFGLMASKVAAPAMTVRHDKDAGSYTILEGKAPVLRYNFGRVPVPPGVKGKYAVARSNYIHPLYGPGGEELTKDFSPDHPHHRGIYWAWPEVYYAGEKRDLHALQGVFARPVGTPSIQQGPVFARIEAVNQWKWGDKEPIVKETAIIRAFAAGGRGRCVDLEFHFTALVDGVSIARRGQSHYGGLNMRCSSRKDRKIAFHNDKAGSPVRRSWGQIVGVPPKPHGPRGGGKGPIGISILQNSANPDYPGDWQPYPKIDWLQPTFPAKGTKYALKKDRSLVLKFRLWVRPGQATDKVMADLWSAYNTVVTQKGG